MLTLWLWPSQWKKYSPVFFFKTLIELGWWWYLVLWGHSQHNEHLVAPCFPLRARLACKERLHARAWFYEGSPLSQRDMASATIHCWHLLVTDWQRFLSTWYAMEIIRVLEGLLRYSSVDVLTPYTQVWTLNNNLLFRIKCPFPW